MSEFDEFVKGIGSDIKLAAVQAGKKAEEAFEISKRRAEKIRLKGRIQNRYQHLGELLYGSMKNGDDISAEIESTVYDLDCDFERIREIYREINEIKNGTYTPKEEPSEEEEEASEEEEEENEIEVEITVSKDIPVDVVTEEIPEEEPLFAKESEFDINID